MTTLEARSGRTREGLPYNRFGQGRGVLLVFQGLTFQHAPMKGMEARFMLSMYSFLLADYTVFVVNRRSGIPSGYTIKDMSDDYAVMVEREFGGPVDVIGLSTGGAICQQFAADHPDLVRKLVIHSSACKLSDAGKRAQLEARKLALKGDWRRCGGVMMGLFVPPRWYKPALITIGAALMGLNTPQDPSDFVTSIEAEDDFDFSERLFEIAAPTLLVAGEQDPVYTPDLFQQTAAGIPDCKLILYSGMGHPAKGREFQADVRRFLEE